MFPHELPHTPHDVGVWTLALTIIFLLVAWIIRFEVKPPPPAKVFDAAVFAFGSIVVRRNRPPSCRGIGRHNIILDHRWLGRCSLFD
jgi:hypothetical protein